MKKKKSEDMLPVQFRMTKEQVRYVDILVKNRIYFTRSEAVRDAVSILILKALNKKVNSRIRR